MKYLHILRYYGHKRHYSRNNILFFMFIGAGRLHDSKALKDLCLLLAEEIEGLDPQEISGPTDFVRIWLQLNPVSDLTDSRKGHVIAFSKAQMETKCLRTLPERMNPSQQSPCITGTECLVLDGLAVHSRVSRKPDIQEGGRVTMPEVISLMRYAMCHSWIGGDVTEVAIAGGVTKGIIGDVTM
ncbi:UNVERIFIED_CONTAM: hypothetical protein FKN15_048561 [Acipenser sinensis]